MTKTRSQKRIGNDVIDESEEEKYLEEMEDSNSSGDERTPINN